MLEQIFQSIITNFDFAYIITVNILTYVIIKILDIINGVNPVKFWQKRFILFICSGILAFIYYNIGQKNAIVLINSAIAAPVAWSWVIKPILSNTKFDYKKIDDCFK